MHIDMFAQISMYRHSNFLNLKIWLTKIFKKEQIVAKNAPGVLLVKVSQTSAAKAQVRQLQTRLAQGAVFHFHDRLRIVESFDESARQRSHILFIYP